MPAGHRWFGLAGLQPNRFVNVERSESQVVYAIVRAGGRQEKVSVGDLVTLDRVAAEAGSSLELSAVMLVDGDKVTTGTDDLSKVKVTAEVVDHSRGKKIVIQKYKNKTGYKKRQGHRSELTTVKVTSIA
ncbi:LSU ribosomal protein L21P [Citricoccus muralis]|uniref:Large ribosomal subunit protein bL21 n=1 Tax=Citricoccus muralis TaxID=169134 RepID=A0A3D9LB12_9MICC|nr:LSU ribosomal protein L21P [Citricoccus muralis]